LAAAAAVFRCDLLILIAVLGLTLLAQGRVGFLRAALLTAACAAGAAVSSVAVDSALWQRWLWPELEVLWLNTAENRSGDWGTSPPLWYFYSAIPRALAGAMPLAAIGVWLERRARAPVAVALAFVGLYSLLPHKELRFIFPVLPLLNLAAAAALARLLRRRRKGFLGLLGALVAAGLLAATLVASALFALASSANYPGGVAMTHLHRSEAPEPGLSVHIGNMAAISGVSRFLEAHPSWKYSKEEGLETPEALAAKGFDRLLTEWPEVPGYSCESAVEGFERMKLQKPAIGAAFKGDIGAAMPLRLTMAPQVYVLSRTNDGSTAACSASSASRLDEIARPWTQKLPIWQRSLYCPWKLLS